MFGWFAALSLHLAETCPRQLTTARAASSVRKLEGGRVAGMAVDSGVYWQTNDRSERFSAASIPQRPVPQVLSSPNVNESAVVLICHVGNCLQSKQIFI